MKSSKSKNTFRFSAAGARGGITLVACGGMAIYLWFNRADLAAMPRPEPLFLLACVASVVTSTLASSMVTWHALRPFLSTLTRRTCFTMAVASSFSNLFLPAQATMALRALFLRRAYRLVIPDFVASTLGVYLLVLVEYAAMATVGVSLQAVRGDPAPPAIVTACVIFLVGGVLAGCLPLPIARVQRFSANAARVLSGWEVLRRDPRTLTKIAGWTAISAVMQNLALWTACRSLGAIDFVATITAGSLGCIANIVGATPGGIGIYEAIVTYIGKTSGISAMQMMAGSLLSRAAVVVAVIVLVPIAALISKNDAPRIDSASSP